MVRAAQMIGLPLARLRMSIPEELIGGIALHATGTLKPLINIFLIKSLFRLLASYPASPFFDSSSFNPY